MKYLQQMTVCIAIVAAGLLFSLSITSAYDPPDPKTYVPSYVQIEKAKAFYDDPRSMYTDSLALKTIVPKELYEKLTFPVNEMKKEWAEVVGFKAPDVVGKKSPEVKPGKYTYGDLDKTPGLKDLFWPTMLQRVKPGGPPFAGNIPEFEIIPTEQWYHSLPVARVTKANLSKVKTDSKGGLVPDSWEGGYPFPKPSGPHKALQIMYNWEKRYTGWDQSYYEFGRIAGYRKDLSEDSFQRFTASGLKLRGRNAIEPYGFKDERARQRGEQRAYTLNFISPRDLAGMAMAAIYYHVDKPDFLMAYIPQMRRIRTLSSSDSQDPITGQDIIYDDNDGFAQKLNTSRFPYEWKVVEETEYLVPVIDGTEYFTKKGLEIRNAKFMRRPIYVIEAKQLDPNYVYGRRVIYVDRETFLLYEVANYNQKDRLYRVYGRLHKFEPDMGVFHPGGLLNFRDYIDIHSNLGIEYCLPAFWSRKDLSLEQHLGLK